MVRANVARQRLIDRLDAAVYRQVTVVCAGAGWGKTLLVSAWAEAWAARRRAPVAWLSLDQRDNDPQIFWAYLVAALRVAGAVTPDNPLAEMGSVPSDERERGHRLAEGLRPMSRQTVLVIDDFHEIDDVDVLREVADLLRHPLPVRIILVTRADPPVGLHRLRAAGQVSDIRADDLAFTGEEAAALVTGHGLTLAPDDVTVLLERTEGWAAGLQLGAGFLAHDGARSIADFAGDVRGVDDYLTEEVLAGRSRRHRRFLLQTSICERICADLANALTNQNDAQRTLEQLEHDNDFVVRLGAKPLWFRYHHLLRDVLAHRLRLETPTSVTELHGRAARWYASNNSVMEALTHAVVGSGLAVRRATGDHPGRASDGLGAPAGAGQDPPADSAREADLDAGTDGVRGAAAVPHRRLRSDPGPPGPGARTAAAPAGRRPPAGRGPAADPANGRGPGRREHARGHRRDH